jgi:hypothetical protein
MWIFYFLIGGIVGFLVGRARGRELDGLALGVLLGPIGWLITFLSKDHRPKCRECGGVIVEGAKKCLHCGSDLLQAIEVCCPKCGQKGTVQELRLDEKVVCPKCKKSFTA